MSRIYSQNGDKRPRRGGCLQALSALAMTRMYYDGSMDDRSALIEEQRILDKSQGFLKKRQVLAALMEMKIGGMKGTPIALPRGAQGNALKRLVSQTPRAAAKEQLLEAKVEMRASLRSGESKLRSEAEDRKGKIQRIAAVSRSARTLLTVAALRISRSTQPNQDGGPGGERRSGLRKLSFYSPLHAKAFSTRLGSK